MACVVDEEHASIGADALVTRWRADGAVVTEPTDLAVAVAHKGFEWVEIETEGRAAHGSRPRGRPRCHSPDGPRARRSGRARPRLAVARRRIALLGTASLHASLIRRRPRAEQLSRSLPPADGAAHGSRRSAGQRGASEVARILDRLRAPTIPTSRPPAGRCSRGRRTRFRDDASAVKAMRRRAAHCTGASNVRHRHRDEFLDRCLGAGRRRHPLDAVRPHRGGPARRRRVGEHESCSRVATRWWRWRATGAARTLATRHESRRTILQALPLTALA